MRQIYLGNIFGVIIGYFKGNFRQKVESKVLHPFSNCIVAI